MKKVLKRRNPVARALALPMLKQRIVPKQRDEKRAKDKLRQSLREYRILPALVLKDRTIILA